MDGIYLYRVKGYKYWMSYIADLSSKDGVNDVESVKKRLLSKVQKLENGCWKWCAAKNASGYGTLGVGRTHQLAHRISYYIHKGLIPRGVLVLHSCYKSRDCVNPDHLRLGTKAENTADSIRDKTHFALGKTECKRGHPIRRCDRNTYVSPTKPFRRSCKICKLRVARESRARLKVTK